MHALEKQRHLEILELRYNRLESMTKNPYDKNSTDKTPLTKPPPMKTSPTKKPNDQIQTKTLHSPLTVITCTAFHLLCNAPNDSYDWELVCNRIENVNNS